MSQVHSLAACTLAAIAFAAPQPVSAQAVIHEQASITSSGNYFGDPVGLRGTQLIVGVPGANGAGSESGELRLYDVGPPIAFQLALVGGDLAAGDHFGGTAAISGNLIVVGADRHGHGTTRGGSAYVFRWNGSAWIEEAELLASDRADDDNFGSGVAVSGERIVVGAPGCDTPAGADQGALYVFEHVAGVWTEVFKGVASDGASGRLGWRVSLDGVRALAASPSSGAGAVYAFERTSTGWASDAIFTPPAGSGTGTFGAGQDVSGDVVAIGMPYSTGSGAVFVYRWFAGAWSLEATLHAFYGSGLDQLGSGIALQGERLLAGARGVGVWNYFTGASYLFERSGGVWRERIQMVPSSGTDSDFLGMTVALDGPRAVVGGSDPANAVYTFAVSDLVGTPFCAGDGSASACPCGNESPAGSGFGCANGFQRGAVLAATGSTSVIQDDLVCSVAHGVHGYGWPPYGTPVLLVAGTDTVNGGLGTLVGDGLKCVNTSMQRLAVSYTAPFGGMTVFPAGLVGHGGWTSGETRYLQAWYRDPGSLCGTRFNTTNALAVTFTP